MAHCVGYYSTRPKSKPVLASKLAKFTTIELNDGKQIRLSSKARKTVVRQVRSTFPEIAIKDVFEVKNTFLEGMYLLKKEEYKVLSRQSGQKKRPVVEKRLFHVTSAENVDSILRYNFDWRRVKRSRFGRGTSFSDDVEYANKYANNYGSYDRAVIVCDVLIRKTFPIATGHSSWNMKIPPKSADTVIGNGGRVYVKFNDNEFIPRFVVYFKSVESSDDDYQDLCDDFGSFYF